MSILCPSPPYLVSQEAGQMKVFNEPPCPVTPGWVLTMGDPGRSLELEERKGRGHLSFHTLHPSRPTFPRGGISHSSQAHPCCFRTKVLTDFLPTLPWVHHLHDSFSGNPGVCHFFLPGARWGNLAAILTMSLTVAAAHLQDNHAWHCGHGADRYL